MGSNSDYTLYSGGLRGAEAAFGAAAEKWNVGEVNYTFEGHLIERDKNVVMLGKEELDRGDVSMEIVSQRMGRSYSRVDKIRKVMQSIFHMINNGYQVFVVGKILADKTVKGGTGWGVELAKLFNRPLSVFDQETNRWYKWENNAWEEDTPVISHKTFSGTGTRYLSEKGEKAIGDLFERSFGNKA